MTSLGVDADPALVDVGGGAHDPVGHHTGIGNTELLGPAELAHHRGDGLGDRVGGRGLRGRELDPLADQQPGVQVDDAALDAASADVDAESAVLAAVGGRVGSR